MIDPETPEEYRVEPVALVGLSCRVPGACDAAQFWSNLAAGVESVQFFTLEEQRKFGVSEELLDDPAFVPAALVLEDIESFDAPFFGMTAREAQIADPQHRLFLELANVALEDAGYDPARYPGAVAVYGGAGANDYQWMHVMRNRRILSSSGLSVSAGNSPDYLATFASYKLNLRGPSFSLFTACSTSLVAMHLACEALRNGECDMALAGGVCIEFPHRHGYVYYDGGITAPDGHCRPFDARAAGTMWGSGGGMVVLKRLADAIADGDHIRALVLGNAVNNDGSAKVAFSAPSAEGQADVVAQALGLAGVPPRTVSYVEAHGTGTALGDPIEVSALSRAYGAGTDDRNWCALGSVKSNIGHLSQGAGVVGVIKTVLAMEHGLIPASLNYEIPNPAIDFDGSPFYVNATLSTWDTDGPRRAGVSSFGIGGTNAHVILEEPPRPAPRPDRRRPRHLLQVAARTETALAAYVEQLAGTLAERPELDLADVAYTLRVGRGQHPHRAIVVATDARDAAGALVDRRRRHQGVAPTGAPAVAFLFSGQGAQYAGMGAQLYRTEPVFAAAVNACADILRTELDGDLREWIFPDEADTAAAEERLRQTRYTQPALFVVEYALARLWESWGIRPAAMIGHSIGEYVAATLAGVFTLPDALRLVAARGQLMQSMPPGAMLAVQADEDVVRADLPDGLAIATVNGPGACVVAGPSDLVGRYAETLHGKDIGSRALRTSHAFHSPMVEPILDEFTALVADVPRQAPRLPFLSNRTGDWITAEQATDPAYWSAHLREAVRFGDCVARLLSSGDWAMVECGPGRQLVGLARMQVAQGAPVPLPSLPGPADRQGDLEVLYGAVGRLWVAGVPFDTESFGAAGRRIPLPTYPFERGYHWVDPDPTTAEPARPGTAAPRGLPMAEWCSVPAWRRLAPVAESAPLARCLLLADGPAGAAVGARLTAAGTTVLEVVPGEAFGRDAAGRYTVRLTERDDYAALLGELAREGGVPTRLVHAYCLEDVADVALGRSFYSLLALGQALAGAELAEPLHVDVVTTGTRDVVGGDVTRPESATVAGFVTVVPLELTSVTARHIDADPPAGPGAVGSQVAAELAVLPTGEPGEAVALRSGRRWAPTFESVPLPSGGAGPRPGGVYLITGGLGGLGVTIAEDLATSVGAKLVLLARTPLPPRTGWDAYAGRTDRVGRAVAAIGRIEAAGGEVLVIAGDASSVDDLRRVRTDTLARFGRLDGIVHAAGLPGGGLVEAKTRAAAERVLAPKVAGTLALAEVFGDLDLDFVALCSSISGLFGGLGEVDYCAAGAFLDAYAHSGKGFSGRVLSLDWGGWLDVGMSAETALPDVLRSTMDAATGGGHDLPVDRIDHPVLTARHGPVGGPGWCVGIVSPAAHWILGEHRIAGVPVMPGTGYLEIARAAIASAVPAPARDWMVELRDVTFLKPMAVPDGSLTELRVLLEPADDGVDFRITSGAEVHVQGNGGWVEPRAVAVPDPEQIRARCRTERELRLGYSQAQSGLLSFGPRWASLRRIHTGTAEALARLEVPSAVAGELDRWPLHPAVLGEATFFASDEDGTRLPLGYGRVTVYRPMPPQLWAHARIRSGGEVETIDVLLFDDAGRVVADIGEFILRLVDPQSVASSITQRPAEPEPLVVESRPAPLRDTIGIHPPDGAQVFRRLLGVDLGAQVLVSARTLADHIARARSATTSSLAGQLDAARGRSGAGAAAVGTDLASILAAVWGDVLGVADVGADDDFFDLGGNSLVAVQLIAQIRKAVDVRLPIRSLFETSTVAGIAALVEKLRAADDGAAEPAPASAAVTIPRLARPE